MLICKMLNPPAQHVGEVLTLEKRTDGTVTVGIEGDAFSFTFDPAQVRDRPDVMFLNKNTLGQPAFTWLSQTGDSGDGYWSSRIAKRIHTNSVCLILLAVDANGEVFAYSLRAVRQAPGFDKVEEVGFYNPIDGKSYQANEALLSNATSSGTLAHYASPSLKAFIQEMHNRQVTMAKLSTVRSLDAIERQLDLMTELALSLAEKAGVDVEDLKPILDHSRSSNRNKSIESVIALKKATRKVQEDHSEKVKQIYADI